MNSIPHAFDDSNSGPNKSKLRSIAKKDEMTHSKLFIIEDFAI
jgi:hypothetical protein